VAAARIGKRGRHSFYGSIEYDHDALGRATTIAQNVAGVEPQAKLTQSFDVAGNKARRS
jgi:hypothetical protein